jgi:D-threonate/D-erythronate kinase
LGAAGIQLEDEVVPLAVAGRLVGGPFHGLPLATKGGLVGDPLAAVACVEVLKRKLEDKTEEG